MDCRKKHLNNLMERIISKAIKNFFTKGNQRTLKAKKNILLSLIIKGIHICTTLLVVPITINYINATQYGIWLTLSSILGWLSFFDIVCLMGSEINLQKLRLQEIVC